MLLDFEYGFVVWLRLAVVCWCFCLCVVVECFVCFGGWWFVLVVVFLVWFVFWVLFGSCC